MVVTTPLSKLFMISFLYILIIYFGYFIGIVADKSMSNNLVRYILKTFSAVFRFINTTFKNRLIGGENYILFSIRNSLFCPLEKS